MGLFGDIIDPSELAVSAPHVAGDHSGTVSGMEEKTSKAGDPFVVFKYDIGEDYDIQEWFRITYKPSSQWDDTTVIRVSSRGKKFTEADEMRNNYANLKRRLLSLGVPKAAVNTVGSDDLIGIPVVVTTRLNDRGYPQVRNVVRPGASGTSLPGTPAGATTQPAAPSVSTDVNPFA